MAKDYNWKREELPLGDVRRRPDLQMRVKGVDDAHARRLERVLRDGRDLEPISVARIGNARYLVDGFHRLQASEWAGRETIAANVARMTLEEARSHALLANTRHGKSLSRADKAHILAEYLGRKQHLDAHGSVKPSRTIAAELGQVYSHETVRTKLKELGVELDEGVEYPGGYKARRDPEAEEAELALEIEVEAWDALEAFRRAMVSMEPVDRQEPLRAARRLVEALERGERPERVREDPSALLGI